MDTDARSTPSGTPPLVISALFVGLAVLFWPGILGRMISLDWRWGNLAHPARNLTLLFGVVAVVILIARRPVAAIWARIFPTRRRLLFVLASVAFSILFSLLLIEAGLRIAGLPFRMKNSPPVNAVAQFDPQIGWVYIPNKTVVQPFGPDHRPVTMNIDENGSRVAAPGVHHDPAKPSILFVGDSFMVGHGVQYEESLTGRLEAMPEFPFQAVNFAVQGYGTDQSLLMLERQFARFNTRAVVFEFIPDHLNRNENYDRRVLFPSDRFLGTKPLFGVRSDGTLYLRKPALRLENLHYSRIGAVLDILLYRYGPRVTDTLTRALVEEMRR